MKQKSRLYLTKGLPASGKSTWAREFVENSNGKVINVCKDDLREMLHADKHSSGRENFVIEIRDAITIKAFEDNKSVIWSDTNLNPIHEKRARELAEKYNMVVEIKDFTDVPLEECIRRDLKRLKSVGEKVIRENYNKYLKKIDEKISQNQTQNKDLPKAIICDLDGTLAKLNGRNPYDASR
ncbi:MAG: AAA family ATPase, partial [Candidatus Sericytochromatia bacterium]